MRRFRRLSWTLLALGLVLGVAGIAGTAAVIVRVNRTPREIAPYILQRAAGHGPRLMGLAAWAAAALIRADRLRPVLQQPPDWIGAAPGGSIDAADPVPLRTQEVDDTPALRRAIGNARAGDLIQLLPGIYRVQYPVILATIPGAAAAPIVVRAARLGTVTIEADTVETFKVAAPYWHFENLHMVGVCADDTDCEHAFHIVGDAHDTLIRGNWLQDFNAQIKINAEGGRIPDHGLIEDNTFSDNHVRNTANPVTPIDLDTASLWLIQRNLITDFIKGGGDFVAYGAYAKSAGDHNVFTRNVVLCEARLTGKTGQRVGLSFGGGGSDPAILRDHGQSGAEQIESAIRENLIGFCSDDGIYLNQAADSLIANNTLIDTAGIDVRFPHSSAQIENNLVDGIIRSRDGGQMTLAGNLASPLLGLFVGWHAVRDLFRNPGSLDLAWRGIPPAPQPVDGTITDLCGTKETAIARPGAFANFVDCTGR